MTSTDNTEPAKEKRYKPIPLDLEIMEFINAAGYVRAHHIVAWTGASGGHVSKRLAAMSRAGVAVPHKTFVPLTRTVVNQKTGEITQRVLPSPTTVWGLTSRAEKYLSPVVMPGSEDIIELRPVTKPPTVSALAHTLAIVDTAVWYRRHGGQVAWERQLIAAERANGFRADDDGEIDVNPLAAPYWTVVLDQTHTEFAAWQKLTGLKRRYHAHRPDLGIVLANGQEVSVEVEIAPKSAELIQALCVRLT